MNQSVLIEVMKKFKADGQLKRKLKIFLGICTLGFLLMGAIIILVSVPTFKHVATLATDPTVQEKVRGLKTDLPEIPVPVKVGCGDKVQSLLSIEAWIGNSVADNLKSLKDACLEAQ